MNDKKNFFRATAEDFEKIPGGPVAYWVTPATREVFNCVRLADDCQTRKGLATSDNSRFLKLWFEVERNRICFNCSSNEESCDRPEKWYPHNKGGEFRRWFGNNEFVINWHNDGYEIRNFRDDSGKLLSRPQNLEYNFSTSLEWSKISTGIFSARYSRGGALFDDASAICHHQDVSHLKVILGYLNSKCAQHLLHILNPTINVQIGDVGNLPVAHVVDARVIQGVVDRAIEIAVNDWNAFETSWDFTSNPLVALARENSIHNTIAALYVTLREKWVADCEEMRRLETENNRIFIDAYGLQDDLTPDVPWHEITLTCNPWYKYRKNKKKDKNSQGEGEDNVEQVLLTREEKELMFADAFPLRADKEELLRCDTAKDLISYAVGCMMGRYSLDKPGLILADQGATEADYYSKISLDKTAAKFAVDDDGIIPILDNDWFQDDIVTRFKEFVKVAFGEEHFLENMTWIEDALGKDIRSYFTKDFYKDHLQRYQNRPIYWLFQSPKGAFRALVYMHRYKPDMVGGVLGYLRSLQTKIDNQLDVAMQVGADESKSASVRVRANKDAVKYAKAKKELDEYEKNVLYPLSTERIEIDLDDGVKVNYRKFGSALRKVAALEAKGE